MTQRPKTKQAYVGIPKTDHIARYCNRQRVIRDPLTGEILGVYPQAFELRPKINETYLSTHWMEFPQASQQGVEAQFRSAVAALRSKHPDVRPEAAFARLNVGRVIEAGLGRGLSIRILSRSKPSDPGYSGIYGMPPDNSDSILLAQLANECCIEVRGVADLDRVS
jgi:hypothetical protein